MNLLDRHRNAAGTWSTPQAGRGATAPAAPDLLTDREPQPGGAGERASASGPRRAPSARASGTPAARLARVLRADPRWYQIAVLSSLLAYGMAWLHLEIPPAQAAGILAAALLTQLAFTRITGLPRFDPLSALISGLSLCLLLRTGLPALAALAAVVAVGSKFVLRVRGKHVFNPTNLAIVLAISASGEVWVSPGQWGSAAVFAFLLASSGGLVVNRAARADVTCAFLACYAGLIVARSLWLGDPLAIPLHRLQNGALVLFAFFMISDPRTTPDSRAGRILFAALVAAGAYAVQFTLFRTNGLLWSLAVCSLAVPAIDRLLPGARHQWRAAAPPTPKPERALP